MLISLLLALVAADTDAPFTINGFTGVSGEIVTNTITGSSIFFWQFDAYNGNISTDTRPLVIWNQGGPGCGSEIGLLLEGIAPITVDQNGNAQNNPSSWNTRVHILSIDFPYDSGFSVALQPEDLQNTTQSSVVYLYNFLTRLGHRYPTWFNRDVYWFGEDYSGHFIPAISSLILQNNLIAGNVVIPLKGIALGNPWVDGSYQTQYYDMAAYNLGLINGQQRSTIWNNQNNILNYINQQNYALAFNSWQFTLGQFESMTGNVNVYNTRTTSNMTFSNLVYFLNTPSIKSKVLNVPSSAIWAACNSEVFYDFENDFMLNFPTTMIPQLLGQIKVMIYHGIDDLYCNTLGLNQWIKNLNWPYASNFFQSRRAFWNVQGSLAGYAQTYSNLTYIQVLDAGQAVGFKQPYAFRDMAFRFIFSQGWN